MKKILAVFLLVGIGLQAEENDAESEALILVMKDLSTFFLTGKQEEAEAKFKALLPNDREMKLIFGKHAQNAVKDRDSFLQIAAHKHYWKLHTEHLRKAGKVDKVEVAKTLNLYTQQLIEEKYLNTNLKVLLVGSQDTRGMWGSYEFVRLNDRWVMLSPTVFEIMTKPEKFR